MLCVCACALCVCELHVNGLYFVCVHTLCVSATSSAYLDLAVLACLAAGPGFGVPFPRTAGASGRRHDEAAVRNRSRGRSLLNTNSSEGVVPERQKESVEGAPDTPYTNVQVWTTISQLSRYPGMLTSQCAAGGSKGRAKLLSRD